MATSVQVTKLDGGTERVLVEFPAADMEQLARFAGDEARLIDLFCDRPPGWSRKLSQESLLKLFHLSWELNVFWHRKYEAFFLTRLKHINSTVGKGIDELFPHL